MRTVRSAPHLRHHQASAKPPVHLLTLPSALPIPRRRTSWTARANSASKRRRPPRRPTRPRPRPTTTTALSTAPPVPAPRHKLPRRQRSRSIVPPANAPQDPLPSPPPPLLPPSPPPKPRSTHSSNPLGSSSLARRYRREGRRRLGDRGRSRGDGNRRRVARIRISWSGSRRFVRMRTRPSCIGTSSKLVKGTLPSFLS